MNQLKSAPTEKSAPVRRFPFVSVGMTVLWHSDGNPEYPGCAAIVTSVGEQGIDLAILEPDYDRIIRKTGVRWNHEPRITTAQREDSGGWDFTEADLRLRRVFDEFGLWPEQIQAERTRRDPPAL